MVAERVELEKQNVAFETVPEGWQVIRIGDHFDFKNGLSKAKEFFGKGTPIVNYLDVLNNPGIHASTIKGKVTVSREELRTFSVQKGDVLFTRTSETIEEIGMASAVVEGLTDTVFSGFILRARPKTNFFDLLFKKYCFRSDVVRRQIISLGSKTTRALTSGVSLSKVEVPIPTNPKEQASIGSALSDIDELILQLDDLIAKKKNIKQGAVQKLLSGRERLPGFCEEWVETEIGRFATPVTGGTPNTQTAEYWGGDILWMNSGELNNKRIYKVEGRISKLGLENSSTRMVPEKCVLIGLAGQGKTRGTVAINYVPLCINQSIAAVLPNESFVSEFLYYDLDGRYEELRSMSTGVGGRAALNLGIIKKIPVTMPSSKEEQIAITDILSNMDSEIVELERNREKYIMIKQGMIQQLLTGRVRLL
jgi:type I restriction enzyme S subunit